MYKIRQCFSFGTLCYDGKRIFCTNQSKKIRKKNREPQPRKRLRTSERLHCNLNGINNDDGFESDPILPIPKLNVTPIKRNCNQKHLPKTISTASWCHFHNFKRTWRKVVSREFLSETQLDNSFLFDSCKAAPWLFVRNSFSSRSLRVPHPIWSSKLFEGFTKRLKIVGIIREFV